MSTLGTHLKGIRKSQGMTLAQLSESTGLSISYISKIERGVSDLTLNAANLICTNLGVDLANILKADNDANDIVRAGERTIILENSYACVESLCNKELDNISLTCTTFKENAPHQHTTPAAHDFDEIGIVISGVLNAYLEGIPHILYPGDTIFVKANMPRVFEKIGNEPCVTHWIHIKNN